jgi:hypothetical protein
MQSFSVLRTRILATLAAAQVACSGTVIEAGGSGGSGNTKEPGCGPVPSVDERIAAMKSGCSYMNIGCIESNGDECLDPVARRRDCAAPLDPTACPSPGDLTGVPCTAIIGEGTRNRDTGQCCYPIKRLSCTVPGRPLRVGGAVLLPDVVFGALLPVNEPGLDETSRRVLAELWREGARFEYASVASFARSTLQLMSLGAPPELVLASQAASLDEIEHARLCFALASRFGGREVRPSRLPIDESSGSVTLVELAVENVLGGCVGETVAALTASEQLSVATDPEVRAALETITRDESRHAELAWRIAAWACDVGGAEVRARVAEAFQAVLGARDVEPDGDPDSVVALQGLGLLDAAHERAIRERVLREVVEPCAAAVLAA